MNDPVKIIWKYKNNGKRAQYNTYIFIGNSIPNDINKILEKITDLDLYETWIQLNKNEYKKMEDFYGGNWYTKFFNTYHINSSIFLIKESTTQKRELKDKFGDDWYTEHISSKQLIEKKIIYNYESLIKDERNKKTLKKTRGAAIVEDDGDADYTLEKKVFLNKLYLLKQPIQYRNSEGVKNDDSTDDADNATSSESSNDDQYQKGGNKYWIGGKNDEDDDEDDIDQDQDMDHDRDHDQDQDNNYSDSDQDKDENQDQFKDDDKDNFNDGMDANELLSDEEVDMDEIEQLYKESDVNPDDHLAETTKLIKKALNDDKLFEKHNKKMAEFDNSRDTNVHDEHLKKVYKKTYVKLQYIFKDDTIKTIKDKICCGIRCNTKFDNDLYLIPSRQYLWSEYYYDNQIQKIMIGQKWMRRNELLAIDTEPQSIRIYEELRDKLKDLRDNIRRYNNKIRREDDENDILIDYDNYVTNNELYMIDVYNELGLGYVADVETIKNLQDVYFKLYFPRIKSDDIKSIVDFLNGQKKQELNKVSVVFDTINNDLALENEITDTVENVKMKDKFTHLFKENFITQSVIHLNIRSVGNTGSNYTPLNLSRIFDGFITNETYPFLQYQSLDGKIDSKFSESDIRNYNAMDTNNIISKWFENAPYGISFKIKIPDKNGLKFMSIVLTDNGRIEYKTQWKEEDMATIENIKSTYTFVKNLIKKINSEDNKTTIQIPDDMEFKFAFMNTIQKFELPKNIIINHNDLSNFSRYFFPYCALVIEPRKRQAKVPKENDKSKFGTYLRYKRVSKYENQARIEQRIMYFIRNYEFTEKSLTNEISKQFNITEDKAFEEYERVKSKYPNLKKSRKILKKLENIPKYKPPGIDIDIQGKQPEKYKIRISGARDKTQLDRIILFMNILLFLYIETYHAKIPERQALKKKLEMLEHIAKRRSKVDEIVNHSAEIKNIKQMTKNDKFRIGFKPEKGQNQWSRSCQNSGNDKKKRPKGFDLDQIAKQGFKLNKKTDKYERFVTYKDANGKKISATISAARIPKLDDEGNRTGDELYYACGPEENGDHVHVGFLKRSAHPNGQCMPCCFKKDPAISKNKEKQEYHKQCLGEMAPPKNDQDLKVIGDRLYILQDTNKIQEGRFGFLPKYLDIYLNFVLEKKNKIKAHYLLKTDTGYFFKYGLRQDEYKFMSAISSLFDLSIEQIRQKIVSFLDKDKGDQIFTSLNNGDIKTQFGSRETYMHFIQTSDLLDFELVNGILSVPNVISKSGLNIVVFEKKLVTIKKTFEKEKTREDFIIQCQNPEDIDGLTHPTKKTVFIIKEIKSYYPIVMVLKQNELDKNIDIIKTFKFENKPDNIVNHVSDFYNKNCMNNFMNTVVYKNSSLTARSLAHFIENVSDKKYAIKQQYVDTRNKCKFLITHGGYLIPTRPSGTLPNIPFIKRTEKYIMDYESTFKMLENLYTLSGKKIPTLPIGVYYDDFTNASKSAVLVNSIMTVTHDIVPVTPIEMKIKVLDGSKLLYEKKELTNKIDDEIEKGRKNYKMDDRIIQVNTDKYNNESYQLFRFEFSNYINKSENESIKSKLMAFMTDKHTDKIQKVVKIKAYIYKLIDKELYEMLNAIMMKRDSANKNDNSDDNTSDDLSDSNSNDSGVQTGGRNDKIVQIINKAPNLDHYEINNNRELCGASQVKDKCNINPHCHWTHSGCYLALTKEMVILFINKMSDELASNELKSHEIMKLDGYFVTDTVDKTRYTERENQKIVKSTSSTVKKILQDTLGKDVVTYKIGKKKAATNAIVNFQKLNADHPMIDIKTYFLQKILENNLSLYRAYVNGYYWLRSKYNDNDTRNLGYYSPTQTDLSNYFKSLIIDWLNDTKNAESIKNNMSRYLEIKKNADDTIKDFIIKISKDIPITTNAIIELHVLSKINEMPIVVYNEYNMVCYIFNKGLVYDYNVDKNIDPKYVKYTTTDNINAINLKFSFTSGNKIPDAIDVIYFKANI